jgi:uncharacterized protein YecT (DUF1311 family)
MKAGQMLVVVLAIAALATTNAMAQKKTAPATVRPREAVRKPSCADAATQADMNSCAKAEYDKADAELNRVYQQALQSLAPDHQERLRTAQRAWITFRDADCDCEAFTYDGGSMQPLSYYSCLTAATRERIARLRGLRGWMKEAPK